VWLPRLLAQFRARWANQSRRLLDPSLGDTRRLPINQDPVQHTFSALEQWHRALEDQLFEMRCRLVIGEVLFLTIVFVQEKLVRPLDRLVCNEASAAGLGTALRYELLQNVLDFALMFLSCHPARHNNITHLFDPPGFTVLPATHTGFARRKVFHPISFRRIAFPLGGRFDYR
jgi:hypothetical protein